MHLFLYADILKGLTFQRDILFSENEPAADAALQMRHFPVLDNNKCNMLHNRDKLKTSEHFDRRVTFQPVL